MNRKSTVLLAATLVVIGTHFVALEVRAAAPAVVPQLDAKSGAEPRILVGGVALGAERAALTGLFAKAGIPALRDLKTILEYRQLPTKQGRVKKVRLHFHKNRLYKISLVHSDDDQRDGYNLYLAVKSALSQQYGEDFVVLGDDAATVESVGWYDRHEGKLQIELVFQAVGRVTTAAYIHKGLYDEYLASFRR